MKVIIAGSSGMVGRGVLLECLESDDISEILVINRKVIDLQHPKLKEILHSDFYNLDPIKEELKSFDALFYCIGISSVGQNEESYTKFTYDMTMHFARLALELNENFSMVYCSAAGADSSTSGNIMWARVRGRLENDLIHMSFKSIYCIRPAFIEPLKGVKSKTKAYQILITIFRPIFYLLRYIPKVSTSTVLIGQCMINALKYGYPKAVLESSDINKLAKQRNEKI